MFLADLSPVEMNYLSDVGVLEYEAKKSVGEFRSHYRLQVQLQALQQVVRILGEPMVDSPEKKEIENFKIEESEEKKTHLK